MIHIYLLTLIFGMSVFAARANSVGDPLARITAVQATGLSRSDVGAQRYRSVIITVAEPADTVWLREQGVVVWGVRDNMVLACVPEEQIGRLLDGGGSVLRMAMGRKVHTCLDRAVKFTGVDDIRMEALGTPYTGKGVIVGFSDSGFDPGHVAFRGRLAGISDYNDTTAISTTYTPGAIPEGYTDNPDMYHATHVAGILAGSPAGTPYGGIASGAELFASTSCLYDVGILAGVEDVVEAGRRTGRPVVVNLSLGSLVGPRDGTDAFCRYLDLCGEEATILIAAGNDGSSPCTASRVLDADSTSMAVIANSCNYSDLLRTDGYFDIWSSHSAPVDIRVGVWDILDQTTVAYTPWAAFESNDTDFFRLEIDKDDEFGKYFIGKILAAGEENPDNGRYNVLIYTNLRSTEKYPDTFWSRYSLVVEARSHSGVRLDMAVEGNIELSTATLPWLTPGGSNNSINSLACGKNTIVVGSFTSRDSAPLWPEGERSWEGFVQEGTMSEFSSYGTDFSGNRLPHICAPGAFVVSAISSPYLAAHPEKMNAVAAISPDDEKSYYLAEAGTSMATPHAAGIMALWLEAAPTLTPEELRQIAIETARKDVTDSQGRGGAGLIDAVAGLRQILGIDGIHDSSTLRPNLIRRIDNRIDLPGDCFESISVYNLMGQSVSPDALPSTPVVVVAVDLEGRIHVEKL